MMKLRLFTLGTFAALAAIAMAQEPVSVEYFYDSDPGYGQATAISGVQVGNNELQLSTNGLNCGSHLLCVRSQDSRGLWSTTLSRSIYVYKVTPTAAVAMEYFLDSDPGYGKANSLTVKEGENTLSLDISGTACGSHLLCVRSLDNAGNWSPVLSRSIYVCAPRGFVSLEYYFDNDDPGEGKATRVDVPTEWDNQFAFDVDIESLSVGEHSLCVRGKGQDGLWSVVSVEPFLVEDASGIKQASMTFPVGITAERNTLTLTDVDGSSRGDSRIEVFTTSGAMVATTVWKSGANQHTVTLNAGGVLIVKLTDTASGRQLVRRIICR